MSTEPLEQAIASTKAILKQVQPDQLTNKTPCESWQVSDLINHIVGGQYFFANSMTGQAPSGDSPDFSSGDFMSAFDEGTASALEAFRGEGAMERTVRLPFGELPGSAFVGLAATDTFVHGWDLARAIGQPTDLAPELAAGLLAGGRAAISDAFRGPDGKAPFGPEQQAPAGATPADQLAAFLGRTV